MSELHCRRCDYDLRALPRDSVCPECGESVERSIAEAQSQGPKYIAWVRSLRNGAAMFCIAVIASALSAYAHFGGQTFDRFCRIVVVGFVPAMTWLGCRRVVTFPPGKAVGKRVAVICHAVANLSIACLILIDTLRVMVPDGMSWTTIWFHLWVFNVLIALLGTIFLFLHVIGMLRALRMSGLSCLAVLGILAATCTLIVTVIHFLLPSWVDWDFSAAPSIGIGSARDMLNESYYEWISERIPALFSAKALVWLGDIAVSLILPPLSIGLFTPLAIRAHRLLRRLQLGNGA